MFTIFLALFTVLSIVSLIVLFCGVFTPSKVGMLVTDLGLQNPWWGKKTTAFYRWNWRKASRERVWAERIVKEAFHRAKVWLSSEDCEFFARQCYEFSQNRKVDYIQIIRTVEQIVKRSDVYNHSVQKLVKEILQRVWSTNENEAVQILRAAGVDCSSSKALPNFGIHEVRRTVESLAARILVRPDPESAGEDLESRVLNPIQGPEGWRHWLYLFRSHLLLELENASPRNEAVNKAITSSVRGGLLQDFEEDILDHTSFVEILDDLIGQNRLYLEKSRIREVEDILYSWQFNQDISFTSADHRRIRHFLTRKDLYNHFQEIILNELPHDFESLGVLLTLFPRKVVFFGENATAREFAAEQYLIHLVEFLDVFARLSRQDDDPPASITIPAADIENVVKEKMAERTLKAIKTNQTDEAVELTRQALAEVIDQKKKRSIRKRKLDPESADLKGWLINLAWDGQATRVFDIFHDTSLESYAGFGVDGILEVDFISDRKEAKWQRWMFFKAVLDTLIRKTPPAQPDNKPTRLDKPTDPIQDPAVHMESVPG